MQARLPCHGAKSANNGIGLECTCWRPSCLQSWGLLLASCQHGEALPAHWTMSTLQKQTGCSVQPASQQVHFLCVVVGSLHVTGIASSAHPQRLQQAAMQHYAGMHHASDRAKTSKWTQAVVKIARLVVGWRTMAMVPCSKVSKGWMLCSLHANQTQVSSLCLCVQQGRWQMVTNTACL